MYLIAVQFPREKKNNKTVFLGRISYFRFDINETALNDIFEISDDLKMISFIISTSADVELDM